LTKTQIFPDKSATAKAKIGTQTKFPNFLALIENILSISCPPPKKNLKIKKSKN